MDSKLPELTDRFSDVKGGMDEMISPITESQDSYSPLQLHFLRRLHRLLRLRAEKSGQVNEGGLRLIDRAIYSTYCDLVDLGIAAEAQKLLHRFATPSTNLPQQ
jgi:hypothetical protein